jgi:hypothetical protein
MTTPGRVLRLTLPLPPPELNPNGSRGGYIQLRNGKRLYKRSTAAAEYRGLCRLDLEYSNLDALCRWDHVPFYFARLSLRFVWCNGRHAWDADNCLAAAKPAVDALRDCAILRDDGAKRVTYGGVESVHCPRGCRCKGRVELEIAEVRES